MSALYHMYTSGVRRTACPRCGGGISRELSFSLFVDEETGQTIIGKCFRAGCGFVTRESVSPGALVPLAAPFIQKPLCLPYRLKEFGLFGERVLIEDPTVTVWQLYDINGRRTGHVTRDAGKRILMFKEVPEPVYYSNGLRPNDKLWVFEDPRSAALCRLPAVALLGTYLPGSLLDHLTDLKPRPVVYVALDPGAENAAAKAHGRLRDAGIEAVFVPMSTDFKDMHESACEELLETYS